MAVYKHTQVGYVMLAAAVGGGLLMYASTTAGGGRAGRVSYRVLSALAVGAVLFSSLTVCVDSEEMRFYFGPGFWKKRIALRDIEHARVVRNAVIYGWGIRYTPHGWLYNVSGRRAVELVLRSGKALRVGTDEPEALRQALRR